METDLEDARFITLPITGAYVAGSAKMGTNVGDIIVNLTREAFGMTDPALIPVQMEGITDELDYTFGTKFALTTDRERLSLIKDLEDGTRVWGIFNRINEYDLTPEPTVADLPVWTVDAGPTGVLISYGKRYDPGEGLQRGDCHRGAGEDRN